MAYQMMKNQNFGIEIEMTGLSRREVANVIANHFGTQAGSPDFTCYETIKIMDNKNRYWKVERDSSIRPVPYGADQNKVEVVSPILQYEDIETLQEIIREIKAAGASVNESCGIHVHVDGANHTMESLRRLVNLFVGRQDLIYEALNIGDRADRWCKKMNPDLLHEMKKNKVNSKDHFERIWYSNKNEGGCVRCIGHI